MMLDPWLLVVIIPLYFVLKMLYIAFGLKVRSWNPTKYDLMVYKWSGNRITR